MTEATEVSADRPVLVDRFLDDAIEIDVDALFDGDELYLGGVMEHIEEAGIHSGDSACVLPPITLGREEVERVRDQTTEAGARASASAACSTCSSRWPATCSTCWRPTRAPSRTAPFVSKATGVPLAKAAARIMLGATIADLRAEGLLPDARRRQAARARGTADPVAVKEAVLPFKRFRTVEGRGVDHILGPEMRSTGEVMGIDAVLRHRVRQVAGRGVRRAADQGHGLRVDGQPRQAGHDLPGEAAGRPRLRDRWRPRAPPRCCAATASRRRSSASTARAPGPDGEPTVVERILAGEVDMVVNTPSGRSARADGYEIRAAAIAMDRPIITTVQELAAAVQGIEALGRGELGVRSLQDWTAALRAATRGRLA